MIATHASKEEGAKARRLLMADQDTLPSCRLGFVFDKLFVFGGTVARIVAVATPGAPAVESDSVP